MTTRTAPEPAEHAGPSRRQVLLAGGAVAAGAVVAACAPSSSGNQGGGTGGGAAGVTVKTSDVPVNGGTILRDAQVVVTQPQAGTYKAFSAVCTHEGCTVTNVENNTIICPCHGAQFSASDGAVIDGPAPAPLAGVPLTVSGDTITLS